MSVIVLLLGAGRGWDAAAGSKAPEDVPAFTYEQYCDAKGHFTYDGAALKLVKRPAHLARVYGDAAREDARAKVLVGELEYWFHQAGVLVADTTTRPACLPLPEMTPECQPNWQFLTEFLGDTPEASRLRQVVAHAYEVRARDRRLQNNVIVAGVNLLLAGGMAKGVLNQAATAEARGATGQALAVEAKAAQAEGRAAGQGGIAAEGTARPANTTRLGVNRTNPADWRQLRDVWDQAGLGDILSDANRAAIAKGRTPVVDDAWIKHFPGDAALKGEKIPMHHIGGSPITVPLPASRHLDAHIPGGFRNNPGGPGTSG